MSAVTELAVSPTGVVGGVACMDMPCRIEKALQHAGLSKKEAVDALAAGHVAICSSGMPMVVRERESWVLPGDDISLNGVPFPSPSTDQATVIAEGPFHEGIAVDNGDVFALFKPRGMEVDLSRRSTAPKGDLASWMLGLERLSGRAGELRPLMHVGRLDKDTSGLLLVTDDGDLASRVCEPRLCMKVYEATVRCRTADEPNAAQISALTSGVHLAASREGGPACTCHALACNVLRRDVRLFRGGVDEPEYITYFAVVRLSVDEGRNRLVRRMLAAVGLPVHSLLRTAVGPVSFDALAAAGVPLAPGDSARVPPGLVSALWRSLGGRAALRTKRIAALWQCAEKHGADKRLITWLRQAEHYSIADP